jgi:hypothetical protein
LIVVLFGYSLLVVAAASHSVLCEVQLLATQSALAVQHLAFSMPEPCAKLVFSSTSGPSSRSFCHRVLFASVAIQNSTFWHQSRDLDSAL